METFVIYCKSYRNDLNRVQVLAESVERFNVDKIPFYISCPGNDYDLFKNSLPPSVILIKDEDIVGKIYDQSWNNQQTVKCQFWKHTNTENYLCIDSDSYFIKPFYYSDFLANQTTPYTVMHQQKGLFQWTARYSRELGFDPQESFNHTRDRIGKDVFGRALKINYDFGPTPVIWSSRVWKSLEDNYMQPNNITYDQLISYEPSELTWYGEALLAFKAIEIYPIEPLFMVFHYPQQLQQFYQQGYTEEDLSKCYYGIIMTSNWNAPLKY